MKKKIIYLFLIIILITNVSFAHPGRTDSNGGHWDYSTGTYHYHNGKTNQDLSDEETEMIFTDTADYAGEIKSLKAQVETLEEDVRKKRIFNRGVGN